jgi:hypothetical protein
VHPSVLEATHGGSVCAHLRVLAPSLAIHLRRRMLEQMLSRNQTKLLIRAFVRHGETTHGNRLYILTSVCSTWICASLLNGGRGGGVAEIAVESPLKSPE